MIQTPLHPSAQHKHKFMYAVHGMTQLGKQFEVHFCTCGEAYAYIPAGRSLAGKIVAGHGT